ncbi:FAD-binding protein [Kytococcus sedentarius]|uniref:L-aspartate oxidase n=1 Tax=Kytococcus sedentarius (strain ATCC 14392 / DSM 20547 / JCM 11482 / CCUG 33030 / NBRC 15357 / NCTC 11040 / CCM 314 / 541) TaxID=478801 RepID=C7NF38_KYTSD|nr:FAD-binding protein [Kytococcus sedentarius]ACV07291.1 aspartate oxidase [Kytococcus sedentarius DSM 20547]QQB63257.1 FAD-binding protein [Kytococcus sedentarius]STX13869.1 L-aspartate oxidase [Kytococcus sedentarius]
MSAREESSLGTAARVGASADAAAPVSAPVVVVGAGLAGMVTALRLAPTPVLLVSPLEPGRGGSTELAQGGLAAAMGTGDTPAAHAVDTHAAGGGLCDAATVTRVTDAGPDVVAELTALGVTWDRTASGPPHAGAMCGALSLGREGGHGRHRIVHAGDRTGAAIAATLADAVSSAPHITHLASVVTEVVTGGSDSADPAGRSGSGSAGLLSDDPGRVTGVVVRTAGGTHRIATDRVVLATGGYAGLYALTTNPSTTRGAGLALAARAGARLADLEFVQFHPTALDLAATPAGATPAAATGRTLPALGSAETAASLGRLPLLTEAAASLGRLPLLTEALRGAGAVLLSDGHRFVDEVAPRDVVAAAVHAERRAGRRVELDCRAVPDLDRFTALSATAAAAGLDPRRDPLPVCPAAHYSMGGVLTDARARTDVPGLWAVGEVACTGLHGANRLASNSLLEAVTTGRAAAEDLAAWSGGGPRSADAADASHAADAADDRCRPPADPLAAWHDGWRSPVAPHRTIRADAVDLALAGTPRDAAPPASAVTGDPASRRHVLGPDTVVSELLSVHAGVVRTRDGVQHALTALADRPGDDALVARLLLRSALRRAESVGGHRWGAPDPAAPGAAAPGAVALESAAAEACVAPGATLTASGVGR